QPTCGEQLAELYFRADPAARLVEQHQDVESLGRTRIVATGHQHLDDQHSSVNRHGTRAVAKYGRRVGIAPVHQHPLDDVGVAALRDRPQHVAADDLASDNNPSIIEWSRVGYNLWKVEQDSSQ